MSEKESNVTALVEASTLLRKVAWPERGKRALAKLDRLLPWSYRHIKAVYYQEERTDVSADEMKQLKNLEEKQRRRREKLRQENQEAVDDVAQLRARLARLESILLTADPEFHRETLETLRVVDSRSIREDS